MAHEGSESYYRIAYDMAITISKNELQEDKIDHKKFRDYFLTLYADCLSVIMTQKIDRPTRLS